MNQAQIKDHNAAGLMDVSLLLDDLEAKTHTPYLSSVIVARGMWDTIHQIIAGRDTEYHTDELTPYQRVIFVWAYLEALTGFIEFALQSNTLPEAILVPK